MTSIEPSIKFDFDDVLIRPKWSNLDSRSTVDLNRKFIMLHSKKEYTCFPIVAANMDTVGSFTMAHELIKYNMMTAIHKHYSISKWENFLNSITDEESSYVFYTIGTGKKELHTFTYLKDKYPTKLVNLCVDIANGYRQQFIDYIKIIRQMYPNITIMAGNVATPEMTQVLLLAGTDIVKIGIGPGSVCTTRKVTGVGYPQLSAIMECADVAHGMNGHICSDGGCRMPGDIAKAFGGGADFIMLGGMLAGHDQCEGEIIIDDDGKKHIEFYGMSSETSMEKHNGGVASYRSVEGKRVLLEHKGDVNKTVREIKGGIASTCTYIGASRLKDLAKGTTFIRVNQTHNIIYGK